MPTKDFDLTVPNLYTESKKRPVIMTIETEEKKKEIYKNLQKLRRSDENITITHDLTQKQRKELQELISEAKRKEFDT